MYNSILFDLDGTLTDPGVGITNSVSYALKKYRITVTNPKELYRFIGPPLHESFETFYHFSPEKAKEAVEYYREYYSDRGIYENILYPGIEDLLKQLKESNKHLIVATSKPEKYAKQIIDHFALTKYFDYIAGANMDGSRTKKSEVISYAIASLKIKELSQTVMIGDREYDIFGAKQNGIDALGVLYGYGAYQELADAGADYIAEKPKDILNIILSK